MELFFSPYQSHTSAIEASFEKKTLGRRCTILYIHLQQATRTQLNSLFLTLFTASNKEESESTLKIAKLVRFFTRTLWYVLCFSFHFGLGQNP